jgi:hypothetical protein
MVMDMAESGETLRVAVIPEPESTNLVLDVFGPPPTARREVDPQLAARKAGETAGIILAKNDWGIGTDGAPTNGQGGTQTVPRFDKPAAPREVIPTYPHNGGQTPPEMTFPRGVPSVPQGGYGPVEEKPFAPGSNPRGIDAPPVIDPRPEKQKQFGELSLLGYVVGALAMLNKGTRPIGVITLLGTLLWSNRPR